MSKYLKKRLLTLLKQEQKRRLMLRQRYDWLKQARPNQLPPTGNWQVWLILAGRGFGKTRTGAEAIRLWIKQGLYRRV